MRWRKRVRRVARRRGSTCSIARPSSVLFTRTVFEDVDRDLLATTGTDPPGQVVGDLVFMGMGGDRRPFDRLRFGGRVERIGEDADGLPRPSRAEGFAGAFDVQLGHAAADDRASFAASVRVDGGVFGGAFDPVEDRLARGRDDGDARHFGDRFELRGFDRERDRLVLPAGEEDLGTGRFQRFEPLQRAFFEVGFDYDPFAFAAEAARPFDRQADRFGLRFRRRFGERRRAQLFEFGRQRSFRAGLPPPRPAPAWRGRRGPESRARLEKLMKTGVSEYRALRQPYRRSPSPT